MTPEGEVKKKVEEILRRYEVWYFKPVNFGYGKVGVPDFICCVNGKFLGIETKAEKGVLTINQQHQIEGIKQAGGMACVVKPKDISSLEEVIVLMKSTGL